VGFRIEGVGLDGAVSLGLGLGGRGMVVLLVLGVLGGMSKV
jgi:hypothetical protein